MNKCKTCRGFGLWKIGDRVPIGPMDAADGMPTLPCPICKANGIPKNSWRTLDGQYIPIPELTDDHLLNIIKHVSEREYSVGNKKILKKILIESKKRQNPNKKFPITLEKTGSVGGRINTRKWNSKREDVKDDQHNPKKKWYYHDGLKRTKKRWNKKKGVQEISKKGSRDKIVWCD